MRKLTDEENYFAAGLYGESPVKFRELLEEEERIMNGQSPWKDWEDAIARNHAAAIAAQEEHAKRRIFSDAPKSDRPPRLIPPGTLYGLDRAQIPIRFQLAPYVPMTMTQRAKRRVANALHDIAYKLGWRE